MKTLTSVCAALILLAACASNVDDPALFPTPPPGQSGPSAAPTTSPGIPESSTTSPSGFSTSEIQRGTTAIQGALSSLGLQSTVSYEDQDERFFVEVLGGRGYNNAQLAELIINVIGDEDQPGAMKITHAQLKVRIRNDPSVDQPCTCGFR